MTEDRLLEAAREGDEAAFASCSSPTGASCTRTVTGCSARRLRRRRRAAGRHAARLARPGALRGPQLAALVAVHDRHEHLPDPDRAPPEARAARRLRPGDRPVRRPRRAGRRERLDRAVPGHRARGRAGRPRGPLRAAREHRARVHRRAPAPAGDPARRPDPARGAGLHGQGGRREPGHDRRVGQQRAAARPRVDRGARAGPSQQATLRALGDDELERDRQDLRRRVGAQRRRHRRLAAGRGRGDRDAAARELVRPARRVRDVPAQLPDVRRIRGDADRDRQRAARVRAYAWTDDRLQPSRSTCSRCAATGSPTSSRSRSDRRRRERYAAGRTTADPERSRARSSASASGRSSAELTPAAATS